MYCNLYDTVQDAFNLQTCDEVSRSSIVVPGKKSHESINDLDKTRNNKRADPAYCISSQCLALRFLFFVYLCKMKKLQTHRSLQHY